MAEFTMELKKVIEIIFNTSTEPFSWEQPYADITYQTQVFGHLPTVPDWKKLGLGYYPIFDEAYRPVLNGLIVSNFFRREICVETIDLWLQFTQTKMQNIMPYYNQMYLSTQMDYGPFDSMHIETDRTGTAHTTSTDTATNSASSETDSKARAVSSETPQTMLSGSEDYATGATDSNSQTTSTSSGTSENDTTADVSDTNNSVTTGYQGSKSNLMNAYRASLINVNMMVMSEMQELFMGILNSGDDYTNNHRLGWF